MKDKVNWEQARVDAAIAAMPIADNIVDGLYGANYHSPNNMHTINFFGIIYFNLAN